MKKVIITIISIIAVVSGLVVGGIIYNNHIKAIADYELYDEVFEGYTDSVGSSDTGKDFDSWCIYTYGENDVNKFANSDLYSIVNENNIDELCEMVTLYESVNNEVKFSDKISVGDYFILKYYDNDGNEISRDKVESGNESFKLWAFDVESQSLLRIDVKW